MIEAAPNDGQTEIVAKPGTEYRLKRYAFVALMLIFGLALAYDGFVRYPAQQAKFNAMTEEQKSNAKKPPSDFDIRLQKQLAAGLIPLAVILLAYFLYSSRGVCRLSGEVLYVPGHPPVPLENIRALGKEKWERKGIADVEYETEAGNVAKLRLDDFAYQYQPIRAIVDRIEAHLDPQQQRDPEAHEPGSGA